LDTALLQIQKENLPPEHVYKVGVQVDAKYIKKNGEVSPFLLEGCNPGMGELTFVVEKEGKEISRGAVRLELNRMGYFYDIYSVSATGDALGVHVDGAASHSQASEYKPKTDEKLLLVHGWNMESWEKRRWAETANYNTLYKPDNGFGYFFGYTGDRDIYLEISSRFWRGCDQEHTLLFSQS